MSGKCSVCGVKFTSKEKKLLACKNPACVVQAHPNCSTNDFECKRCATQRISEQEKEHSIFLEMLEKALAPIKVSLDRILARFDQVESRVKKLEEDNHQDVLIGAVKEMELRSSKARNVIVYGLQATDDDVEDKVTQLFNAAGIKHPIEFIKNIPTTDSSIIRVEFQSVKARLDALSKAKSLKNIEKYKKVYINPDVTPLQHQLFKDRMNEAEILNKDAEDGEKWIVIRKSTTPELKKIKTNNPEKNMPKKKAPLRRGRSKH